MLNKNIRKTALALLMVMIIGVLAACGNSSETADDKKELKIGFFPGPYADQFKRSIQPILEAKGYKLESVEFTNALQPNTALSDGTIDANIFQHTAFLESYKEQQGVDDLTGLVKIPSAPAGVYSDKFKSLDELKDGAHIGLPNDPSNMARSLILLEKAGILKLKGEADPLTASEKDIAENPKNVKIVPLDAPQLPRALGDVDYAVIPGNTIISASKSLSDSLLLEEPAEDLQIIVAVKEGNKDKTYLKDLAAAYQSPEFKKFIETDEKAKGFSKPEYMK
ncbi:hypothetical protein SY83_01235 [Paenibacillus swuensis]|uniref:Lipoprotein n=1 Tax=Paenibacillus swuensis TaxID=1178515 RepID=A0A172TDU3_9BACL|nr:MetQ/NlpA family ABC transporter substrate-binding protein [Paenibacillus swuensis]ANE45181.1 hypothetical protein SY83_01235 [Paenibacillus swuensis]